MITSVLTYIINVKMYMDMYCAALATDLRTRNAHTQTWHFRDNTLYFRITTETLQKRGSIKIIIKIKKCSIQ